MGKVIYEKDIVTELKSEAKIDLSIFKKKSSGRTAKGICLGYLKKLKDSNAPFEYLKVLENLYKEIENLETSERIRFESWKGKSGIRLIPTPDKVICITHQKSDKGEKAKEIKKEILKEDINKVILAINKLSGDFDKIPTSAIAEAVYHKKWEDVFSSREEHIRLTYILNILEYYGVIHYFRSGHTKVLKEIREIQEVLK